MHTCLSLANIGGHWYVERAVANFMSALNAYCDSIDWCNVAVEGPSGADTSRSWRIGLKLRIFDEIVRATARVPEGPDPAESLSEALADVYASATAQMTRIAQQHQGCCCHRAVSVAALSDECA